MVYIEKFEIETTKNAVISITENVKEVLNKSGVKNGLLSIEVPHSTIGVVATTAFVEDIRIDMMEEVKRLVPSRINFKHEDTPDDAAGHIKCALFGTSVTSIVKDGNLVADGKLGYFLMEYDGPRKRNYYICVLGE
ncbi:MAG: YjbQ family protein [Ruminococcaceae bacterium]|nr:YjbQ family protein [Oscillospiraceae bacterium]